jgi:hypothetical protein
LPAVASAKAGRRTVAEAARTPVVARNSRLFIDPPETPCNLRNSLPILAIAADADDL